MPPCKRSVIGTRNESTLHRQLKKEYAGNDGRTEVELSGFVADAVNSAGQHIEVQIGSFGPLKKKAGELAARGGLRVICPIIVVKHLEVFDERGRLQSRKKSPKYGSVWDLFSSLVYAPELPRLPGLEIELAMVEVAEERVPDGRGSRRRGGMSIRDRRMLVLHERICLKKPSDYLRFVPFARGEEFTSKIFKEKAKIRVTLARKVLYVLAKLGVVEKIGRRQTAYVYRLALSSRSKKWKKPAKPS